jgi:trans-2,3-dihydro-3-hydroxyanthranilate isomerase
VSRPFYTLDVFTGTPLEGNPLAVVLDASGLDTTRMQAMAREFNLSETVFVLEPRDPVNSTRIRIFTPANELPFAGHPTVGAAALIAHLRAPDIIARQDLAVIVEEEIGPVHCLVRRHKGVLRASFTVPRLPVVTGDAAPDDALAVALGLAVEDIGFEGHRPCVASAGVPFTFVPLRSLAAAGRAWPDQTAWPEAIGAALFLYTQETSLPGSTYHARMFAPAMGMIEDPATGAAAAALAAVLLRAGSLPDGDHTIVIEQGIEMERPSLITLGLDIENGALKSASIGGTAVILSEGHLHC